MDNLEYLKTSKKVTIRLKDKLKQLEKAEATSGFNENDKANLSNQDTCKLAIGILEMKQNIVNWFLKIDSRLNTEHGKIFARDLKAQLLNMTEAFFCDDDVVNVLKNHTRSTTILNQRIKASSSQTVRNLNRPDLQFQSFLKNNLQKILSNILKPKKGLIVYNHEKIFIDRNPKPMYNDPKTVVQLVKKKIQDSINDEDNVQPISLCSGSKFPEEFADQRSYVLLKKQPTTEQKVISSKRKLFTPKKIVVNGIVSEATIEEDIPAPKKRIINTNKSVYDLSQQPGCSTWDSSTAANVTTASSSDEVIDLTQEENEDELYNISEPFAILLAYYNDQIVFAHYASHLREMYLDSLQREARKANNN